jgi:Ca-activated chloride channel family protein
MRLLLVEDDKQAARVLTRGLGEEGFVGDVAPAGDVGEELAATTDDQVLDLARQTDIGVYAINLRPDRPQDRERLAFGLATYFLTALARDTGGQVYFPAAVSELDTVYGRVAEELRSQYTLGYVSSNSRRDGKWRRIVVSTPSRDLQIRHKRGYRSAGG